MIKTTGKERKITINIATSRTLPHLRGKTKAEIFYNKLTQSYDEVPPLNNSYIHL